MEQPKHERYHSANKELRTFLQRAENAANGTCMISEGDFQRLSRHLTIRDFSIGESSRSEVLDSNLQGELAEYVSNLRAFQTALENVRSVMLDRRMHTAESNWDFSQSLQGAMGSGKLK